MASPSPSIICVDCGGPAHLITLVHDDHEWTAGEVVAYRCRDCRDRWDLVLTEEDLADENNELN